MFKCRYRQGWRTSGLAFNQAAALYARARNRGQRSGLGFARSGRSCCLFTLDEVGAGGDVRTRRCEGIQVVPVTWEVTGTYTL